LAALACGRTSTRDDAGDGGETTSPADDPSAGFTSPADDDADSAADDGGAGPSPDLPGDDGGGTTGGGASLDDLDDDFDGSLDGWHLFQPELAQMDIEGGQLVLQPFADTVWIDDRVSVLLWKAVEGDFVATAAVTSRRAEDPGALPNAGFRFGGLMARNPDEHHGENYVFVVLGTDIDPSVESKSTRDSASEYAGPPWPSASGEVRICRVGSSFRMLVREGGAWQVTNEFVREDMPAVLQVGPIAYNNDPIADLRVSVDWVDFEEVDGVEGCAQ
jgi:hypothetical protein